MHEGVHEECGLSLEGESGEFGEASLGVDSGEVKIICLHNEAVPLHRNPALKSGKVACIHSQGNGRSS